MLKELFAAIDSMDAQSFTSFLSPQCRFRFGNLPAVDGAANIGEFVAGFFASIQAVAHDIEASYEVDGGLVCHGQVTYTRHDGSTLSVPFANVFQMDDAGIRDYLIFADTSALYA